LVDIKKQIEDTRDELNMLIASRETIAGDKELLRISVKLDKLINQYIYVNKNEFVCWNSINMGK